jgi:Coenzyme PQQ synthesis protein D (PqqD)
MKNRLYVARSPLASARRLGDQTLVMSAPNSILFTLNEIASLIWEAADGVTPLDQVVANKICSEFDVEPETAQLDAEAVVKDLAAHGILVLSDLPMPGRGVLCD